MMRTPGSRPYFTGIGWVPFDPTPLTGADAARAVALPWAPHPDDEQRGHLGAGPEFAGAGGRAR